MASDEDDDDRGLQQAIKNSLADQKGTTESPFEGSVGPHPIRRANIEDRIKEMSLQPALELPLVHEPAGDTWVFIDPPPKQPEQDQLDYARYTRRYATPMVVKKATLLEHCTPDSTVDFNLESLFGPSAQFRTVRRRNLTNKLRESPNVKYVIDLTPPAEGDDAVYLTTELCCPEGVRLWYQAGDIWKVSQMLIGGNEEYTSAGRLNSASSMKLIKEETNNSSISMKNTSLSPTKPGVPMPLEYSPVRHRSAIERVLAALVGIDPRLDSAPKVWTTFAVAKYLGIKASPVTDYIVRWLRAYPNSFFLEVCPEVALRIADGLEIHDLARDTFAILVGEEALGSLYRARLPDSNHQRSVYGRRKEDLPERMYSRIEYASKRLLERINKEFKDFAGEEMPWVDTLPEVQNFSSHPQPQFQSTISALKALLKQYVRGTIYKLLCVNYDYVPGPDYHHSGGDELIQKWSRSEVWADLSVSERILSRTFWHALISFGIFEGKSNLDIRKGWNMDWEVVHLSSVEKHELELGTYREVRNADLYQLIRQGNDVMLLAEEQPQTITLPDRSRMQARSASVDHLAPSTEPYESDSDLDWVQTPSHDISTADSLLSFQPCELVNTPRIAPKDFQFNFDPTWTPDSRIRSQGMDGDSPYGAPRNVDQVHVMKDGVGHHLGVEVETTDLPRIRFPPPPGFKFWSSWEAENNLGHSGGLSHELSSQQRSQDGRSASPLVKRPPQNAVQSMMKDQKKQKTVSNPATTLFFSFDRFSRQAKAYIEFFARRKLQYADSLVRKEPHEIGITTTLVCLEDSEWKYLPLWAGGYDDGTGGVFNDQIPPADLGFSAPGPEVHTGVTPANSIKTPSEFSMVDSEDGAGTVDTLNTSMANNQSFADALHRKRIYAAESIDSQTSGDFDMVTIEDESVEDIARRQTEAQEQVEAAEEAQRIERGTARVVDENYADLFNDDEGDETDGADDGEAMINEDDDEEDDTVVL